MCIARARDRDREGGGGVIEAEVTRPVGTPGAPYTLSGTRRQRWIKEDEIETSKVVQFAAKGSRRRDRCIMKRAKGERKKRGCLLDGAD